MKSVLLKIGPVSVYGYGLMIAVGILAAYVTGEYRAKKKHLEGDHVFNILLCCVIGGFAGAKLLFWITEWKSILRDPGFLGSTVTDGFVVYGGILGGIFSACIYCRRKKLRFLQFFDVLIPSVALAQGFGRIGCFLAGCCYGRETDSHFSVIFHTSEFAPNGVSLIPVQLYASCMDFLNYGILLLLLKHKRADGQVAGAYLIFYSIGRFILEFFRGDLERGSVGIFSTSQFIAFFTLTAGILLFALPGHKNFKKS